jgi:hypothetical protein
MTRQDIKRAIHTLRAEHPKTPQRDHAEGLLTTALDWVSRMEADHANK